MRRRFTLVVTALIGFAIPSRLGGAATSDQPVIVERSRSLMGTLCTATARGLDRAHLSAALAGALDEIARLEEVMSSWRLDSELARLNASSGRPFHCSADLFAVLDSARTCAEQTHGAFDPSIEPLAQAWDLRGSGALPTDGERQRARALVDWRRLGLDRERHTATLGSGMGIDLGGIGKGFALDRARERLLERGVRDALLNFGGEILVMGREAPAESGWTVRVAHPSDRLQAAVVLGVSEAAVSTSAQSEHRYRVGVKSYGHVLDPHSGQPVNSAASVTVVTGSATRADALSTALLVMGRDKAEAWCSQHSDVGALWLEPSRGALHAWAWNLPSARAAAGQSIQWRTPSSAARAVDPDQP